MRIEDETKLDFDDVLIRPKRTELSSRKEVDLQRTYTFKHGIKKYCGTPIIAANMDHTGTFDMVKVFYEHDLSVALNKHYSLYEIERNVSSLHKNNIWYSMGITDEDFKKFEAYMNKVDCVSEYQHRKICIDVANGYQENFIDFVKKVRDRHPSISIMAGNVVTADVTEQLILAGADIVKIGIGPGSVCTTRLKTGVGYPQLSAIIECADAAHGLEGHVCADGGCKTPGDIAKAFGAGADFVMLGGVLAGHDECGGDHQASKTLKKEVILSVEWANKGTPGKYRNSIYLFTNK